MSAFASEVELIESADSLFPDSKLTLKNESPHNLTSFRYRTNQPASKFEEIIEKALGSEWQRLEVDARNLVVNSELKAHGMDVLSTAQFGNKTYSFQHVIVRYINERKDDGFAYTVSLHVMHVPAALKK